MAYALRRALTGSCFAAVLSASLCPMVAQARPAAVTGARQLSSAIHGTKTFPIGPRVTHVAVHWRRSSHAPAVAGAPVPLLTAR